MTEPLTAEQRHELKRAFAAASDLTGCTAEVVYLMLILPSFIDTYDEAIAERDSARADADCQRRMAAQK